MSFNPNIVTSVQPGRSSAFTYYGLGPTTVNLAVGFNAGVNGQFFSDVNSIGSPLFTIQQLRDTYGFEYPTISLETLSYSGSNAATVDIWIGLSLTNIITNNAVGFKALMGYLHNARYGVNDLDGFRQISFAPYHLHQSVTNRASMDSNPNIIAFAPVIYCSSAVTNFNLTATFSFIEDYNDDYVTGLGLTTRQYRR